MVEVVAVRPATSLAIASTEETEDVHQKDYYESEPAQDDTVDAEVEGWEDGESS